MDEDQTDQETLPKDEGGFIGKHMKKLADKQRKLMEEKLANDEEEMLKSGIDIKPKYTKMVPKKKAKARGIMARMEEKLS
jgi:TRAP-type C4-dicarboxylate transport system substrate-binding protein